MFERVDYNRSVELSADPVPGLRIQARILRNQNFGIHIRFDGTLADDFIRLSEAVAFVNAMKALFEKAKEVSYELRQKEEKPVPKKRAKKNDADGRNLIAGISRSRGFADITFAHCTAVPR
jgi:hypothetical protein